MDYLYYNDKKVLEGTVLWDKISQRRATIMNIDEITNDDFAIAAGQNVEEEVLYTIQLNYAFNLPSVSPIKLTKDAIIDRFYIVELTRDWN